VHQSEGRSRVGLPVFRGVENLRTIMHRQQVDRLVVAYGATRDATMVDVLRACEGTSVAVHVLPRFFELGLPVGSRQVDDVWGYRLVQLRRPMARRRARLVKRAIDVVAAAIGLALVSPLYAVLAVAVKLSSAGPVHFRQLRLGQNEEPIEVLKFRTLRVNPRSDTDWNPGTEDTTAVGRVLRMSGLDELPQLWNILRGEMSLVGPRPERPFFVEKFKAEIPRYGDRHRVPAGLTGLAQVHGLRGDTPIDERARLDNQYIENWSLWQDAVILVSTISAVVRNGLRARRNPADSLLAEAQHTAPGDLLVLPSDPGDVISAAPSTPQSVPAASWSATMTGTRYSSSAANTAVSS
jgi:exopolysaccharide biosynthesis polyprenyl glycosylphosphotransferase